MKKIIAVCTTALLAVGMVVGSAVTANAHTGDMKAKAVCNTTTGEYDVTYTLTLRNAPTGQTAETMWKVGESRFTGTPSSSAGMDRGPIKSSSNAVLTLGIASIPGTSKTGPWVYAYTKWSGGYGYGSDTRVEGLRGDCFKPDALDAKASAVVTPATCDAPGSVKFFIENAAWYDPADTTDGSRVATAKTGHSFEGGVKSIIVRYEVPGPQLDQTKPPCVTEKPDDEVVVTEWTTPVFTCDTKTGDVQTLTKTTTTTPYVLSGRVWVKGTPVVTTENKPYVVTALDVISVDAECAPAKPADVVIEMPWSVIEITCDSKVGDKQDVSRTVITTPYVLSGRTWVPGKSTSETEKYVYVVDQGDVTGMDLECSPEEPETKITGTAWTAGNFDCTSTSVTETRVVTTVTHTLSGREWLEETTSKTEKRERELTDAEKSSLDCEAVVVPKETPAPTVVVPVDKPSVPESLKEKALPGKHIVAELPFTGVEPLPMIGLAALLLILGSSFVGMAIVRRRR